MKDDELIEALASRIWDVGFSADTSGDTGGVEMTGRVRLAIAAEVARQMEWARRDTSPAALLAWAEVNRPLPLLTVAPEDWRAE
jgi:hypothetical protein